MDTTNKGITRVSGPEHDSSGETIKRLALAKQYGSYENYQEKVALRRAYNEVDAKFTRLTKEASSEDLEQDDEFKLLLEHNILNLSGVTRVDISRVIAENCLELPYWLDPFALSEFELSLIGSPEGSKEWTLDHERSQPRYDWVSYQDYTSLGWPRSAGSPIRMVTEAEHREILRRLKAGGLTKPGAEVPTVGKTMAAIVEDDRPQPGWIIKDILRRGGAAMVYGPSGIGKTWLTHTIMLLAAAGGEAGVYNEQVDRWTLQAGEHKGVKVCLLDGEMIEPDIGARVKALCSALGLKMVGTLSGAESLDTDRLRLALEATGEKPEVIAEVVSEVQERETQRILSLPDQAGGEAFVDLSQIVVFPKAEQDHRAEFVDLASPEWKHRIVEYCKSEGIELLILDNLATLSESLEDENSAAGWIPLNSLIVALKKEGVATLLVHHTNKTGQSYRGSTSIETTLEQTIKLEKVDTEAEGAAFKVSLGKNRSFGKPEVDGKTLRLRTQGNTSRWVSEVDPMELAEAVVELAKSRRYKTQAELGVKLGFSQGQISKAIKTAARLGLVEDGQVQTWLRDAKDIGELKGEPEDDDEDDPLYKVL